MLHFKIATSTNHVISQKKNFIIILFNWDFKIYVLIAQNSLRIVLILC